MDRRQQKTRDAVFAAFGALISKKSYSRITIQDIIDEANVGRTTFYAHFDTKDSLLEEMCVDLFSHVFSSALSEERTHNFAAREGNAQGLIAHVLHHLKDNDKNIIAILSGESGELFLGYFRRHLHELLATYLLNEAAGKDRTVPRDFLLNHLSSSFIGMVQWWISRGLKPTPEEVAGYYMMLIGHSPPPAQAAGR